LPGLAACRGCCEARQVGGVISASVPASHVERARGLLASSVCRVFARSILRGTARRISLPVIL